MHEVINHVMSNPLLALGAIMAAIGVVAGLIGVVIGAVRSAIGRVFYAGPARFLMIAGVIAIVPGLVLMGAYAVL